MLTNATAPSRVEAPAIQPPRDGTRRVLLGTLYIAAVVVLAVLLVRGWSYYTTPYVDRPHHADYRTLRSAGTLGLTYGIVGAGMMILMLVYSLQKRLRFFGRRVPLRPFLDVHIFLGVVGPLFIVLHTSFKVQGLVAISFWSMVAVALSGYLGRYLYQQIPRNMNDQELSLHEIENVARQLFDELKARTHLDDIALERIAADFEAAYSVKNGGAWRTVVGLIVRDLQRPWTLRRLRQTLRRTYQLRADEAGPLVELATQRALLKRRLLVLAKVQRLFHWWHVIHKPFAIIMYLIMAIHIGVAVWTGYAWLH